MNKNHNFLTYPHNSPIYFTYFFFKIQKTFHKSANNGESIGNLSRTFLYPKFDVFIEKRCLESQFGEEPLVLSALVAILEAHANLETCLLSLNWVLKVFNSEFAVECDFWDTVACWHQMVVVDELKNCIEIVRKVRKSSKTLKK